MSLVVLFGFGLLALSLTVQNPQQADTRDSVVVCDTTRFEQVFVYGLQGRVAAGLVFLDSLEESSLTPRQSELRKKFYTRFRSIDEKLQPKTDDTAVIRLIRMYDNYWRNGLLDNAGIPHYDTMLADSVSQYLLEFDPALRAKPILEIQDDFPKFLSDFLQSRGVYSAVGRTGQLFDLLLHTRETESHYNVTTPEDTITVKVVFMENTISNGWEEYATFGRYFPGGWATDDALYCVRETYDTASENFTISYLKHEGKHFADYKRFPKLTGTDLEYRAKLVELSYARKSLYDLIAIFMRNSLSDRNNPHAFANHCVMRDLARQCQFDDKAGNLEVWKKAPISMINASATSLLRQNTSALIMAGADTVSTVLQ